MAQPTVFEASVTLKKSVLRRVDPVKLRSQVQYVASRVLGAGREKRGWKVSTSFSGLGSLHVKASLTLRCTAKRDNLSDEAEIIVERVLIPAANVHGWTVETVADIPVSRVAVVKDYKRYFDHIYERDDQVDIVMSAVEAALTSNLETRAHTLLYGEPACGKTEILRSVKSMFGDAALEYDGTATTAAGAFQGLQQRQQAGNPPKLFLIEELEKADEAHLRYLLALLDQRAEVRKRVFNTSINFDVKVLCIATVNNFWI